MDYKEYCLGLLKKMVAIPSNSGNEKEIAHFLYSWIQNMGLDVELKHVSGNSYNVIAKYKANKTDNKKTLILGGHIDTVPVNGRWKTDPYELVEIDNKLYGLGSGDMKAGLAAQITVLKKCIDENYDLKADIEFIGLSDEERYSIGANDYIKERKKEKDADFIILAEPHYEDIVIGATGKVLLSLEIEGKTGHAAKPETGINAIDCMATFINKLNEVFIPKYEKGEIGSLSILKISSDYKGYSLSIPKKCCALLNKQLMINEDIDEYIETIKNIYKKYVGKGILTIKKEIPSYSSYKIKEDEQYVSKILKIFEEKGYNKPELIINKGVSDGNILYTELGVPTVLFGPQGKDFHKQNEYVLKQSIFEYMEVLEEFIKTL